jgi:hypothetical protein
MDKEARVGPSHKQSFHGGNILMKAEFVLQNSGPMVRIKAKCTTDIPSTGQVVQQSYLGGVYQTIRVFDFVD